jgi:hypothetical protein
VDILKLLRSVEELIFEAVSWVLFYPRTIWRVATRPLTTMAYSDAEQAREEAEPRYDDALSPTLLLLFTVGIVNLAGYAFHVPTPPTGRPVADAILNSQEHAALFRALIYGLIPLVSAASYLVQKRLPLDRAHLRPPFSAQCFLTSPFALVVGVGQIMVRRPDIPSLFGQLLMVLGLGWFIANQTRWFAARLDYGLPKALSVVLINGLIASIIVVLAASAVIFA